jgi:hypothetical protein
MKKWHAFMVFIRSITDRSLVSGSALTIGNNPLRGLAEDTQPTPENTTVGG